MAHYWKVGLGIEGRDGRTSDKSIKHWSAAFISYCMRAGGVTERQFPRCQRHMGYIHFAVNNLRSGDPDEAFSGHRVENYSPKAGDLLGFSMQKWVDYKAAIRQARGRSHTDMVAFVRPGMIGVIGGNVQNGVTLRLLKTNSQGRVIDDSSRFFVVLENRLPMS